MFNNDVYGFTSGVGVRQSLAGTNFGIDYAFTPFDVFDSVHRFSLQFFLVFKNETKNILYSILILTVVIFLVVKTNSLPD